MANGSLHSLRQRNGSRSTPKLSNHKNSEKAAQSYTITWDELEEWQKDNEYIVSGYRRYVPAQQDETSSESQLTPGRPQNHWRGCLESVFAFNIHTHLWGAVLFAYFSATFYGSYIEPFSSVTTWQDSAVFLIFLLSAALCLFASALFHTSGCHSEEVASRCHAYDYSGIIILTVGSCYPALYYGFFCHSRFQLMYLTGISLAGLSAACIVLSPEYSKPTHRGARTLVFIGLGLSGLIPVSHLILTRGIRELVADMGMGWLLTSAMLYIVGAFIYANRIPERLAPGRFDRFFASHQIFHVCVVLAALAHYRSVIIVFAYRLSSSEICGM